MPREFFSPLLLILIISGGISPSAFWKRRLVVSLLSRMYVFPFLAVAASGWSQLFQSNGLLFDPSQLGDLFPFCSFFLSKMGASVLFIIFKFKLFSLSLNFLLSLHSTPIKHEFCDHHERFILSLLIEAVYSFLLVIVKEFVKY